MTTEKSESQPEQAPANQEVVDTKPEKPVDPCAPTLEQLESKIREFSEIVEELEHRRFWSVNDMDIWEEAEKEYNILYGELQDAHRAAMKARKVPTVRTHVPRA